MSIVMKFGGTSVADAAALENVARIVAGEREAAPVVVVSAMSGVTDALLASVRLATERGADEAISSLKDTFERHRIATEELLSSEAADGFLAYLNEAARQIEKFLHDIANERGDRRAAQDAIVSFGELLSSRLLAEVLQERGVKARQVHPRECIVTNDEYTCAAPLMTETCGLSRQTLLTLVEEQVVSVVGGFVGATKDGMTTTLGRGGSDYTAAILGAALRSAEIQIWTDVTGVLTADPRVVHD